ncbi:Hypothetical protein CINCED_3A018965 [Cinara cedri]|uniref:Uncharacterized protein n=1 Tax=Cinara cedri TaxID=506608 RepID=A0A5E4LX19_9HEMI|nr:Hypothetical protein CINCED_3A018965 [Cinara cedri]
MVRIRMVLMISIAIFAIDSILHVEAGKGTDDRVKNLSTRASVHKDKLKSHTDMIQSKYGSLTKEAVEELTNITNFVLNHIMDSTKFKLYLKNTFETLEKYAVGQINSRVDKLRRAYTKWELKKFQKTKRPKVKQ